MEKSLNWFEHWRYIYLQGKEGKSRSDITYLILISSCFSKPRDSQADSKLCVSQVLVSCWLKDFGLALIEWHFSHFFITTFSLLSVVEPTIQKEINPAKRKKNTTCVWFISRLYPCGTCVRVKVSPWVTGIQPCSSDPGLWLWPGGLSAVPPTDYKPW